MASSNTIAKAASGWSLEITVGIGDRTSDFAALLPPKTHVSVTFLQGSDGYDTIATSKRLMDEGMLPAPHISARLVTSHDHLAGLAAAMATAGITEVVVIAGSVKFPLGPFASTQSILETELLQKAGINRIGVSGYPEGNPYVRDTQLAEALAWKNDFAQKKGLDMFIATQFCLDGEAIVAWEKAIREAGNRLPIRVGIAGPATVKTLFRFTQITGVGPSVRFIAEDASHADKLQNIATPAKVMVKVAEGMAGDSDTLLRGFHYYPFGGLVRTADWAKQVAAGNIKPDNRGGFRVT